MTVIDGFDDKGSGAPGSVPGLSIGGKTLPQHEIDAQATREKMARLRALRLAQEAANPQPPKPARAKRSSSSAKGSAGKSSDKSVSLSDWLATQQKEGRRN
jgi:hypothetical protein